MDDETVTIRDVAKLAGVAVSTASRALSGGSASEKTRQKVRQAAEALHFVPNQAAKQLTSGKSNVVAIMVPEEPDFVFRDAFVSGMVAQLATSFTAVGLLPFLALTKPHDAQGFLKVLRGSGASGIVVISFHYSKPFADALEQSGKPIVSIGTPHPAMHYPYVDVDNYQGGYDAAKLLYKRGRRNIAVIAGPTDMQASVLRTEGVQDGLKALDLEPVALVCGEYGAKRGEDEMNRILEKHPNVDGVFAESDEIAAGALRALLNAGKRVPEDVALIGFDDFHVARVVSPRLTTFAQPLATMAETATQMMVERLETGEWKRRAVIFPAPMVRRESA
ncbi:LacI family DNA-binding transcriptional regulator [Bifidobacterium sp. 82T10]|uniref:LacI family DNA-binding transcriptional regulator n=1 Tax=Bifidobacterium miconis TaxID=2834435 RepID=A0ABS6WD08_9BIFI|nr:LacI family DNA-binding transcriptional regulator [Bifidobacterium miconis]MBW3091847.1 LacI family DNA-binding transcriptional regulator [Bifidobacterium miconis]